VVAAMPWAWQSSGSRCPNVGGAVGRICSNRVTDQWIPRGFRFVIISRKTGSTCKIEMDVLYFCKNSQFLHAASRQYWEQLSQLCRLQIPNIKKVKNPVIDLVFEYLMNFKRDSTLWEKSDKLSKIPS
jgi:hypothetical protein